MRNDAQPQRVCSLSYRTRHFKQWLAQRRHREPRLRRATLATSSSSHNSKRPEDEYPRPRPPTARVRLVGSVCAPRAFFIIQSKVKSRPKNARAAAAPRRWTTSRTSTSYCSCPSVRRSPRRHPHRSMPPPSSLTAFDDGRASSGPTLAVAHAGAPEPVAGKRARQVAPHSTRRAGTTRVKRKDESGCGWAA